MRLFFQRYGTNGEPLLILHGLFGSHRNWQGTSTRLAELFTVYALDLRNHGESPRSPECNYPIMAEDIAEFCRDHELRSVNLLGHSMGGKVAMQFAAIRPQYISKLVIVDVAPKAYPSLHRDILVELRALDLRQVRTRKAADLLLAAGIPDTATRQFLLTSLRCEADGHLSWQFGLEALYANYDALRQGVILDRPFIKPTLFIRGGRSSFITDEERPLINRYFPAARFVTIPQAGHWVHSDAPVEFVRHLTSFLTSS